MKAEQALHDEINEAAEIVPVKTEEKTIILPKSNPKKNLDETINAPDQYVSWYQYKTQNLDKYLDICPHCKKPTLSAFHRTVVDSAIDYLQGKRIFTDHSANQRSFLTLITYLAAVGTAIYFLAIHVISGIRV